MPDRTRAEEWGADPEKRDVVQRLVQAAVHLVEAALTANDLATRGPPESAAAAHDAVVRRVDLLLAVGEIAVDVLYRSTPGPGAN